MWFRNLKYSHFPLETAIIMEAESFLFVYYLFFFFGDSDAPHLMPASIYFSFIWHCPSIHGWMLRNLMALSSMSVRKKASILKTPLRVSLCNNISTCLPRSQCLLFQFAFYKKRKLALLRGFNSAITLCLPTVENRKRKSIVSEDTTAEKCNRWIHAQISYIGLCVFRTRV